VFDYLTSAVAFVANGLDAHEPMLHEDSSLATALVTFGRLRPWFGFSSVTGAASALTFDPDVLGCSVRSLHEVDRQLDIDVLSTIGRCLLKGRFRAPKYILEVTEYVLKGTKVAKWVPTLSPSTKRVEPSEAFKPFFRLRILITIHPHSVIGLPLVWI
jgi:hypothetical protein